MVLQGGRPRQRMEGSHSASLDKATSKPPSPSACYGFIIFSSCTFEHFIFHFEENFTLIPLCSYVFALSLKSKSFWICHQIFFLTPLASIIMPSSKIWTKVLERSRMGAGKHTARYLLSKSHQSNSQHHFCRVPQAIWKKPKEHPAYILHSWL